jgi:mRNA interferase YafO
MGVRIFTSDFIRQQLSEPELQTLTAQFREYKDTGEYGETFGPDYPYVKPPTVVSAGLAHVHVPNPGGKPFNLRMAKFRRGSDTALVYCHGFFKEDHIYLIGILYQAHGAYRLRPNSWYVPFVTMAEHFRSKF